VFTLGLMMKRWPIVFVGRFIFGLGSDSFIVGNTALLSAWFKGKELAFAFAVNLSISRFGSVLNNIVSPQLADHVSVVFASWFAVMLSGVTILLVLLVYPIDHHVETILQENSNNNHKARAKKEGSSRRLSPTKKNKSTTSRLTKIPLKKKVVLSTQRRTTTTIPPSVYSSLPNRSILSMIFSDFLSFSGS
jgi:MFS family permease